MNFYAVLALLVLASSSEGGVARFLEVVLLPTSTPATAPAPPTVEGHCCSCEDDCCSEETKEMLFLSEDDIDREKRCCSCCSCGLPFPFEVSFRLLSLLLLLQLQLCPL